MPQFPNDYPAYDKQAKDIDNDLLLIDQYGTTKAAKISDLVTKDYNDLENKPTFKTINGEELLGTGDIDISGGGNANYNVDERNFNGLQQYGTPSGFTSQVGQNANWNYTGSSNPALFNSEDYGNYSRLQGQLEINGKLSMAIRTQPIFYSLGPNNELKMTFVFNQNWDTQLGACIGLFGDTFFFNSVSALLTRRCVGVYFDTTTQRFVCVCRNSLTTQVVLDPIPLNISYLKIAITIGNGRATFEVSYMAGGSPVTQVVTITRNIPGYSFSANATYPTLFFEQIGGTSFIFTPSIRRIQLQIL